MVTDVESKRSKDAHLWARHPDDWYVEAEWCSRRLFDVEPFEGDIIDPACGFGRIVAAGVEAGHAITGSDVVRRSPHCTSVVDFLSSPFPRVSNVVANPPFRLADEFVEMALARATRKVAMLLPANWDHSEKRGRWIEATPLYRVYMLTPRPSMPPGPVIEAGEAPGGGTKDFSWFVWLKGFDGAATRHWLRRDDAMRCTEVTT
jgi:hypothetical protein